MFEGIESGQRQLVHMFSARQRDQGLSLTWAPGLCIFMFLKARCFVFSLSFNARFNRFLPMNVFSPYTFFLCLLRVSIQQTGSWPASRFSVLSQDPLPVRTETVCGWFWMLSMVRWVWYGKNPSSGGRLNASD